ncbi:hypothetical protein PCE1_004772 [Barthelona sp. PCE]
MLTAEESEELRSISADPIVLTDVKLNEWCQLLISSLEEGNILGFFSFISVFHNQIRNRGSFPRFCGKVFGTLCSCASILSDMRVFEHCTIVTDFLLCLRACFTCVDTKRVDKTHVKLIFDLIKVLLCDLLFDHITVFFELIHFIHCLLFDMNNSDITRSWNTYIENNDHVLDIFNRAFNHQSFSEPFCLNHLIDIRTFSCSNSVLIEDELRKKVHDKRSIILLPNSVLVLSNNEVVKVKSILYNSDFICFKLQSSKLFSFQKEITFPLFALDVTKFNTNVFVLVFSGFLPNFELCSYQDKCSMLSISCQPNFRDENKKFVDLLNGSVGKHNDTVMRSNRSFQSNKVSEASMALCESEEVHVPLPTLDHKRKASEVVSNVDSHKIASKSVYIPSLSPEEDDADDDSSLLEQLEEEVTRKQFGKGFKFTLDDVMETVTSSMSRLVSNVKNEVMKEMKRHIEEWDVSVHNISMILDEQVDLCLKMKAELSKLPKQSKKNYKSVKKVFEKVNKE